jgi:hypothetical protein
MLCIVFQQSEKLVPNVVLYKRIYGRVMLVHTVCTLPYFCLF